LRLYPEKVEIKKAMGLLSRRQIIFSQAAARRDLVGCGDDAAIGFLKSGIS
jgi:hypothetical protein